LIVAISDNPALVRVRRVLGLAAGFGLVGIAALRAGAAHLVASDPAALTLNAALNGVTVEDVADLLDDSLPSFLPSI
jgi:predicted nicotinamide N-methyase